MESQRYVDYFSINNKKSNTNTFTCIFLTIPIILQFVSFVPMIEWSVQESNINPKHMGSFDYEGFETFIGMIALTSVPAILFYVSLCCLFDYYYYIHHRNISHEWKWQKDKFPTVIDRKKMLYLSCRNLLLGGITTSSILMMNPSIFKIYTDVYDYELVYYYVSYLLFFIHIDLMAYMAHRQLHRPFLYKNIHKVHHQFIAVSPLSALSLHWFEYLLQVILTYTYLWVIPTHLNVVIFNLLYVFVFNVINHSGVIIHSHLPWEPSTQYHDDHHRHFHVNYGQSLIIWDKLFGTLRKNNKIYGEDKFH